VIRARSQPSATDKAIFVGVVCAWTVGTSGRMPAAIADGITAVNTIARIGPKNESAINCGVQWSKPT
jgi:hypothetical protein